MQGGRLLMCVLLLNEAAVAEQLSNAEQLISEVSALLAKGTSDGKVARRIEAAHLTDSLTDKLMEDLLKKYSVGPYTMFALDMQAQESLFLMPPPDTIPGDPSPGAEDIGVMSERLMQYVDNTMVSWLTFVAAKKVGTLFGNQANGYSSPPEKMWYARKPYTFRTRTPSPPPGVNVPIGHFTYLQGAVLRWLHGDFCGDHKVAVFEFTEGPDSPSRQASEQRGHQNSISREALHHGLVSFFPEDGTICRLVVTGSHDNNSDRHQGGTVTGTTVTAFGPVEIDGRRYWFPTRTVIMTTTTEQSGLWLRSISVTSDYHKVDAQSTVTSSPPPDQ